MELGAKVDLRCGAGRASAGSAHGDLGRQRRPRSGAAQVELGDGGAADLVARVWEERRRPDLHAAAVTGPAKMAALET